MKQVVKCILLCLSMMYILIGCPTPAHAETLPPGFLVGDDTGFQAGTDGEYFIVNNDITPGQTFSREITLSNYSKEDGSFDIKLVMNPADETHTPKTSGEINLLEAVYVTLTYQGKVIYQGTIDGNGTPIANRIQQPIDLGTLEVGEVRTIQAEFTVTSDYPAESWKESSVVDFYWLFFASRATTTTTTSSSTPPTGKLPQTGEDWRNVLIGMIAGFILIMLAVLILKKRKHDENR